MEHEEIEDLRGSLEHKEEKYLEEKGWERTCDLPGSVWYWEKAYKGKNLLMPRNEAVSLQSRIDAWERPVEDDGPKTDRVVY